MAPQGSNAKSKKGAADPKPQRSLTDFFGAPVPLAPAAGFAAVLNRPADVRDTAVPHLRIGPPREEKKVEIFETVEEQSKSLHQDLPDFQDGPQRTSGSPRNVETAESDSSRILPQQVSESELADALNVDGVQGSPRTGVFWGNSPTSMRIRRELSNKIRATSTTQPTIPLDFKAAGESESSSKGAEPLLSSGEGRRSGLKRHLSFDNIFSSKNEGSSSSFLFQASKKTKRQHWTGQAEELAGSEAPAEVGGSKLSDMISKAQKLLTATPSRPVAQHSAAGTLSKRTRSPFERSASMSWIHQGRKSPLTTEPLMNVKLPPSQFNFDSDLGISIEDFENAIGKTEPTLQPKRQKYRRFVVLESEAGMREITLRVFDEVETQEAVVILRDSWLGTTVGIGDYINLVGDPEPVAGDGALKWIVNDTRNFLILHPDTLISSTQIAEIVNCVRKAVVDDRIKRAGDFNMAALLGTMMHELIQSSLKQGDLSDEFIARETVRIVADRIEQLYFLGQNEEVAKNHLADLTRSYKQWAASYLAEYPRVVGQNPAQSWKAKNTDAFSIWKVLDIEENIWSPMFGIKGKIDATVCIRLMKPPNPLAGTYAVPLEIKAGGSSNQASHIAQTMIYTLLMTDRYDFEVDSGILFYAKTGDTTRVIKSRSELQSIVMGRNEMAGWLQAKKLPPMQQDLRKCQRCFAIDACTVYHKALEGGTGTTSGLGLIFEDKTRGMTAQHSAFFEKWEKLVSLEEGDALRFRREIWNLASAERAKLGRCLPNMRLVGDEADRGRIVGAVSRYRCTFEITSGSKDGNDALNLLQSQFIVGDPVVVSSESGQFALGLGFVIEISTRKIVLALDHPLTGDRARSQLFSSEDNQDLEGLVIFENGAGKKAVRGKDKDEQATLYRIDKDEMQGAMGTLRNNLVQLFTSNGDQRRRELVVDLRAPVFRAHADLEEYAPAHLLAGLNPDQRQALKKTLSAQDYALILGMPGTGKTTTIATIIQALVEKGKTVLLTSHTHSAVDNVLLKLKESKVPFARIGNVDKVHPQVLEHTPNSGGTFQTVDDVKQFYESVSVVGATCLSITHGIFSVRKFDYCIVDEASQITLPACLGPLRYANVFVLVGDHYQLPPVVRNGEAEELSVSLFRRLSEAHPGALVNLEHQYRMNEDIMSVSNHLIYNQRLRCGTEFVARSMLHVPRPQRLYDLHAESSCPGPTLAWDRQGARKGPVCWLEHLIRPDNRVVFADTDLVPAIETRKGDLVQNETEADLVFQIAEALIACGVEETEIGIISPYRSQLKLISHRLRRRKHIEINTVDKYQGRDKDCIVMSMVRSNAKSNVGDLLRDWRRVNVAVTRSKQKLILVGSRSTLSSTALFQDLFSFFEERKWIYSLPAHANAMHGIITEASASLQQSQTTRLSATNENVSPNLNVGGPPPDSSKGNALRAERQREIALSRLKAKTRINPILNDVLREIG